MVAQILRDIGFSLINQIVDTVLVSPAKLTFEVLLHVKKPHLVVKVNRLFGVGNSLKHHEVVFVYLFHLLVPLFEVKRLVESEGALVVLGDTHLFTLGNFAESVD